MEIKPKRKSWINWVLFFSTIVVVFLLGLLASSITQRKVEHEYVYKPKVKITDWEPRNSVWVKIFPGSTNLIFRQKTLRFGVNSMAVP